MTYIPGRIRFFYSKELCHLRSTIYKCNILNVMKKIILTILIFIKTCSVFAQDLIPFRKGDSWGFSNSFGHLVINPIYDSVSIFEVHKPEMVLAAYVYRDKKVGLIDVNNKFIIPIFYDSIIHLTRLFHGTYKTLIVKKNGKFGLIDYNNNKVTLMIYDKLYVQDHILMDDEVVIIGRIKNAYYNINLDGKRDKVKSVAIDPQDMEITQEENSTEQYILSLTEQKHETIVKEQKRLQSQNKDIFDSLSLEMRGYPPFLYYLIYYKHKVGFVEQKELLGNGRVQKVLIQPIYDTILDTYGDSPPHFLVKRDGLITVLDTAGNELMPLKYENYKEVGYGYVITEKNKRFGFYNYHMAIDIEPIYEEIRMISSNKLLLVRLHGRCGFVNSKGFKYFSD